MRRVFGAIISGAVGLGVYVYFEGSKAGVLAAGSAIFGTYRLLDWLGLLPPPFEPDVRSMLHSSSDDKTANRSE